MSLKSDIPSKLHPSIQQLVTLLFDVELMKKVMMEFEVRLFLNLSIIKLISYIVSLKINCIKVVAFVFDDLFLFVVAFLISVGFRKDASR